MDSLINYETVKYFNAEGLEAKRWAGRHSAATQRRSDTYRMDRPPCPTCPVARCVALTTLIAHRHAKAACWLYMTPTGLCVPSPMPALPALAPQPHASAAPVQVQREHGRI